MKNKKSLIFKSILFFLALAPFKILAHAGEAHEENGVIHESDAVSINPKYLLIALGVIAIFFFLRSILKKKEQQKNQIDQNSNENKSSALEKALDKSIEKNKPSLFFYIILTALIAVFIYGLFFIFNSAFHEMSGIPFLAFDYAVGLTMIFLPCTLPLAFVIVPLVLGKSYSKGIGMAVSFGIGVIITLSFYGILIGEFGKALGIDKVETAKNILYAIAGLLAVLFALGELNIIKFRQPTVNANVPQFIIRQKDVIRAGLMGLFLGNVGIGCPNPLFNAVIIPQIVVSASPFQGWLIMLVQALGRLTPLFILSFLAILGVNATKFLVARREMVSSIVAWSTVFIGGFLLTLGLFSHDWWVLSGMHTSLEMVTQENFITDVLGKKIGGLGHTHELPHGTGLFGLPISLGTPFILFLWIFPMFLYFKKRKNNLEMLAQEEQEKENIRLVYLKWMLILSALLLIIIFGFILPHQFLNHWSKGHSEIPDFIRPMLK